MVTLPPEHSFLEGDRVDHPKFGHGTVLSIEKTAVEVLFDDIPDAPKRFIPSFATKISSPGSRPFKYWDREWQELRAAWLTARRAAETSLMGFRPAPDSAAVRAATAREDAARQAMEVFLQDERDGRHS